tara:strand:+ start:493 stop:672 length:180 start_codon:yes stop_codon:yes gene_type:complete
MNGDIIRIKIDIITVTIPIFMNTILYCNNVAIGLLWIFGLPSNEYVYFDKISEGPALIL